jgi:hypothetical protein
MANKRFEIEIQELLCRVVRINAKSYNAALEIIQEKYKKCEIVLDYNDFANVSYQDINKQSIEDEKNNLIFEIIDYLYDDEKRHFEESDRISRKNHIFQKLERLKTLCR